jgi:coenzyme F420-reducing hydrogenase gamma subunit
MNRPTVGVFGLTGCAGDQLAILNCEERLLDLVTLLDIRDFLTASSANDTTCLLDVAFVEGAVLTGRDEGKLRAIRDRASMLVALGTCAVWGGIAAMDRGADRQKLLNDVYGEAGAAYDSVAARALHEVVKVDLNITGCPVEQEHVLQAIGNLLNGDPPVFPEYPVCAECRMLENNCLLIDSGELCCGPITAAGCHARCPALRVACVGCRGPLTDGNAPSLLAALQAGGLDQQRMAARLRIFAPDGEAK